MTEQETDAFWKAEFQKAHDEVSLDASVYTCYYSYYYKTTIIEQFF